MTGRAEGRAAANIRVEFRLWDVLPQTQIQGTAYTTTQANWRRIAHIMADVIYERLLGEKGYFDTRICYIAATGPRDRRTKRLAIMDQDSENNRFLTDGSWLVLTPRFHPTRDEIAFMSYANNRPRVYLFDLRHRAADGARRVRRHDLRAALLARRRQRDHGGRRMAAARTSSRSTWAAGAPRRLTDSGAIDVSPCYSPDGSADRVQLRPRRRPAALHHGRRRRRREAHQLRQRPIRHAGLVAARRPDRVHAVWRREGNFSIGVMHPDGSGERILSEGWESKARPSP